MSTNSKPQIVTDDHVLAALTGSLSSVHPL